MISALDRLARWRSPFAVMRRLEPVQTRDALRTLEQRFAGLSVRVPAPFHLDRIWETLNRIRETGNDFEGLDRRSLRHGPWVMFNSWQNQDPLAADKNFTLAYLKRLRREPIGSAVLNLAQAFLRDYPAQLPTFALLCRAIPALLGRCQSRRCRLLSICNERFGLFNASGPETTWNWLSAEPGSLGQALTSCCLTSSLGYRGFAESMFLAGLRAARIHLPEWNPDTVARLLDFSTDQEDSHIRFPTQRVALAESLLIPFTGRATQTGEQVKSIQDFVMTHYGDPRLDRSRWQGVAEEAIRVAMGWLVEETLEDFFLLLEYTSQDDEVASRHWRYRQAFWSAYLRAGLIEDAWVVLAHEVGAEAKHRLNMDQKGYGRFERGVGVQRNHAALIMRIGQLVVTEWSHSGKFRVWDEGQMQSDAPRFYQPTYKREHLVRGASYEGSHAGSEHGTWQVRLASRIKDSTGISFRYRELMPPAPKAQAQHSVGRRRLQRIFTLEDAAGACGVDYPELRDILKAPGTPMRLHRQAGRPRWQLDSEELLAHLWSRAPHLARRLSAFLEGSTG